MSLIVLILQSTQGMCLGTALVSSKPLTKAQNELLGQLMRKLEEREDNDNEDLVKRVFLAMAEDKRGKEDADADVLLKVCFTIFYEFEYQGKETTYRNLDRKGTGAWSRRYFAGSPHIQSESMCSKRE